MELGTTQLCGYGQPANTFLRLPPGEMRPSQGEPFHLGSTGDTGQSPDHESQLKGPWQDSSFRRQPNEGCGQLWDGEGSADGLLPNPELALPATLTKGSSRRAGLACHPFLATAHRQCLECGWAHGTPRMPTPPLSCLLRDRNRAAHQIVCPKAGPSHPLSEHGAGKWSEPGEDRAQPSRLGIRWLPFSWLQQGLPSFSLPPEPLRIWRDHSLCMTLDQDL